MISLLLEAFIFKAVEAGGPFLDFLEAGIGTAVVVGTSGGSAGDSGSGGEGMGVGREEGGIGGVALRGTFGGDLHVEECMSQPRGF